jgi:hypothetical protein
LLVQVVAQRIQARGLARLPGGVEDEVLTVCYQRFYLGEIEARERVYTVVYLGFDGTRRIEDFGEGRECCHIILSFNALLSGAKIDTFSLRFAYFFAYPFVSLNILLTFAHFKQQMV